MSEQEEASVGRFLDGLDDQYDEDVRNDERRRLIAAAPPKWEYQTWTTIDTKDGRAVRLVNGKRLDEYPLEHVALAEAGEQGWELVGVAAAGARQEITLYFKRRLTEG